MRRINCAIVLGLAFAGLMSGPAGGEETGKVPLLIKKIPGSKRTYKNLYRTNFYAERARELSASTSGSTSLTIDLSREWTVEETYRSEKGDTLIAAVMVKGSEMAMINSQVTTIEIYPWNLEDIKGREVTWHLAEDGTVTNFLPAREPERLTVATVFADLSLIVQTEFYPMLPPDAKGVGDSWSVERTARAVYDEFQNFEAQFKVTSTMKVKGRKKKGSLNCLEIEETRLVHYRGWMNTSINALILEGQGKGRGTWLLDTDNGVVVEHQVRMDLEPKPTVVGEASQRNVNTRMTIWAERKLER